jgi:hypothetical protein
MLIDSGSEMCVMSYELWQRLADLLPINTGIHWSIGSANATHNRVFGVCHSVAVDIEGVGINIPVFLRALPKVLSLTVLGSGKPRCSMTTVGMAPFI